MIAADAALTVPPPRPPTKLERSYQRAWAQARQRFGAGAVGCNLLGGKGSCHVKPTRARIITSLGVLGRMLQPPAQTVSATPAQPLAAAPRASATAGGLPACASESGTNYSTGPANTNPSSGATGRYQITPGTAANYGCSLSTPAGQDACAQVIYRNQGAGAWVGCGG